MIRYRLDLDGLTSHDLAGFWEGWPNPPGPERRLAALRSSEVAVLAIDDAAGRVVGVATAVGDGNLAAFIPFLEVLPAYRGQGIGHELIRRILDRLADRYAVDLVCDDDLVLFYETLGFNRHTAMIVRRPEALGGG